MPNIEISKEHKMDFMLYASKRIVSIFIQSLSEVGKICDANEREISEASLEIHAIMAATAIVTARDLGIDVDAEEFFDIIRSKLKYYDELKGD